MQAGERSRSVFPTCIVGSGSRWSVRGRLDWSKGSHRKFPESLNVPHLAQSGFLPQSRNGLFSWFMGAVVSKLSAFRVFLPLPWCSCRALWPSWAEDSQSRPVFSLFFLASFLQVGQNRSLHLKLLSSMALLRHERKLACTS